MLGAIVFCLALVDKKETPFIEISQKAKIITEPAPEMLPYVALKFRSGTVGVYQEGKTNNVKRAAAYGILNGIDDKTFQEITDEFYAIFTNKLKAVGHEFKSYDAIKSNEIYQKFSSEVEERHFNHRDYGTADVFTQNNVPYFKYPTIILKPMKFISQMGADLVCLRLAVDFAEFDMSIADSWGYDYTTTNYSAKIIPGIKITSNTWQEGLVQGVSTGSYFNSPGLSVTNKDGKFAWLTQQKPIFVKFINPDVKTYDSKAPEFAGGFRFFGGAVQLGTWVVKPTQADYKRAALEALTKYADEVVLAINREKK